MNKFLKILLAAFTMIFVFDLSVMAELTKEEKKQLKKRIKYFKKNPEEFQDMLDGYETKIDQQQDEIEDLQSKLDDCESSLETKDAQLDALNKKVTEMEEELAKSGAGMKEMPDGLAFKIQVGYYNFFDISEYFDSDRYIGYEEVDGGFKYLIGYFTDIDSAEKFTDDMRKMGISDAFVASYKDGERITKEEAEEILGRPITH